MNEDKIIEGNSKIAEYMGAVPEKWYEQSNMYNQTGIHYAYPTSGIYPDNVRHHSKELLKYHKSWEWLMPVVLKINETSTIKISISQSSVKLEQLNYQEFAGTGIEVVWDAVVQAINLLKTTFYKK